MWLLTATATVAMTGDAKTFKWARAFAAFLGLVPRQSGSSGRVKLPGKRGDVYLRTLFIHEARAVISHKQATQSMAGEVAGTPATLNVAVAGVAINMTRTI